MTFRRLLSCTLATIMTIMTAAAQQSIGSWQIYNNFTSTFTNLIDTPDKVYFVSDGDLFSYDKDSDEIIGHTSINSLSDNVVADIRRNYGKNFTVIFYQSGNIDLLHDDGSVTNLPDIMDAQSVPDKTLYDVAFDGDDMYVATGFGLVRYDIRSGSVKESGIYNQPVYGVTTAGEKVILTLNNTAYAFDKGARFSTLSHLTLLGQMEMRQLESLTDNLIFATQRGIGNGFGVYRLDTDNNTLTEVQATSMPAQQSPSRIDDSIMLPNPYGFFIIRPNTGNDRGFSIDYHSVPEACRFKNKAAIGGGLTSGNKFWYANALGLGYMTHDGSYANFSVADNWHIIPTGTNIDTGVAGISAGSRGLYFYNRAASRFPRYTYNEERPGINLLDNGFFTDITPDDIIVRVPFYTPGGPSQRVIEDPADPSVIYFGSWFEGLHVNRDGKDIVKFDWRNTPADSTWCHFAIDFGLDPDNNLWLATLTMTGMKVMVLPADKRMSTSVKASDWTEINIGSLASQTKTRDFKILPLRAAKNRNIIMFADGFDPNNIAVLHTGGNVTSTSGHTSRATDRLVDQDGKTFGPVTVSAMAEDNNGSVWVGTTSGVFAIHTPANMLSANATVERIKVPRNDGTSLADYLLDNQTVTAIAVDGANRKWLGTDASGVYLVSADGKEILENFNTSNSPLPSNTIKAIACDPGSNHVYIATSAGLARYSSTAAPAEQSYDNVYAYPNPVRPDYDGWITVTGLMDNSLVKITDVTGNVMHQTRSSGGMVTWNGCNPAGRRVRSGVYYVFATTDSDSSGSSEGKVVTKILVVN